MKIFCFAVGWYFEQHEFEPSYKFYNNFRTVQRVKALGFDSLRDRSVVLATRSSSISKPKFPNSNLKSNTNSKSISTSISSWICKFEVGLTGNSMKIGVVTKRHPDSLRWSLSSGGEVTADWRPLDGQWASLGVRGGYSVTVCVNSSEKTVTLVTQSRCHAGDDRAADSAKRAWGRRGVTFENVPPEVLARLCPAVHLGGVDDYVTIF